MPKILLTDISIKSLNAPDKGQVTYWDDKLTGFGCRLSQGGQKTFIVMYGPRDARRRKVIGKYPLIALKTARDEAKKILASLALGLDADKPRKSISFDEARQKFLDLSYTRNKARTARDYERLLTRHFKYKGRKLSDLSRIDLQKSLSKLVATPSEYHHAYTAIRIFFNWAYREELVESNPSDRLQKPKQIPSRNHVLEDSELKQVINHSLQHPWPYGAIVALCLLTGQRRGEIAMIQWDWIDQTERTITWPGELVKNGRTHTIPYGNHVQLILDGIPRFDNYLFSGGTKNNSIFNGWGKAKKRFDVGLVQVAPYTLHDLRRTFSTTHAKIGSPIHITERLLNHVSGTVSGVAAIYNRYSYMDEMREAVEQYDAYISALITE